MRGPPSQGGAVYQIFFECTDLLSSGQLGTGTGGSGPHGTPTGAPFYGECPSNTMFTGTHGVEGDIVWTTASRRVSVAMAETGTYTSDTPPRSSAGDNARPYDFNCMQGYMITGVDRYSSDLIVGLQYTCSKLLYN